MPGAQRHGQIARAAIAAVLVAALGPTEAVRAQSEPAERGPDQASSQAATRLSFTDSFAPYSGDSRADLRIPSDAVDLSTFEPKRQKRAPALGGSVVRSLGTGVASYYGRRFHGRLTANGERFNMRAMTAAHKKLPFGTKVRVTNSSNGRAVVVRINDRGPFIKGRTIDLSRGAAEKIGMISRGHARVKLEIVK